MSKPIGTLSQDHLEWIIDMAEVGRDHAMEYGNPYPKEAIIALDMLKLAVRRLTYPDDIFPMEQLLDTHPQGERYA